MKNILPFGLALIIGSFAGIHIAQNVSAKAPALQTNFETLPIEYSTPSNTIVPPQHQGGGCGI